MEGGELGELSGEGTGEVGGRKLEREEADGGVLVEREVVELGGGQRRVAGERGEGVGGGKFEAAPLAERGGRRPGGEEEVGRWALKGGFYFG